MQDRQARLALSLFQYAWLERESVFCAFDSVAGDEFPLLKLLPLNLLKREFIFPAFFP
jgi:hypothetical protein